MPHDTNITWHPSAVTRAEREARWKHRGAVVWFTGLSGSGKSTISNLVDQQLHALGLRSYVLDGDNVRHGLNASRGILEKQHSAAFAERFGLGFAADDREENIRRIGAVAQLFADAGIIALTAFVSPYRRDRDAVRTRLAPGEFIEVFVDTPLAVCEARDPKGLYRQARAGQIRNFTGIDDPYEPPLAPEVTLHTDQQTPDEAAAAVINYLRQIKVIASNE